jgi:hypothetical protein
MWRWLIVVALVGCARTPAVPQTEEDVAAKVAGYQAQIAAYDAKPRAAGDTFCAEAVGQVQQYKAPGALVPITTAVELSLSAERRPVKPQGWSLSTRAGEQCIVAYEALIGNEAQRYTWVWTPATGKVDARDAATKRLSGW